MRAILGQRSPKWSKVAKNGPNSPRKPGWTKVVRKSSLPTSRTKFCLSNFFGHPVWSQLLQIRNNSRSCLLSHQQLALSPDIEDTGLLRSAMAAPPSFCVENMILGVIGCRKKVILTECCRSPKILPKNWVLWDQIFPLWWLGGYRPCLVLGAVHKWSHHSRGRGLSLMSGCTVAPAAFFVWVETPCIWYHTNIRFSL